MIQRMSCYLVCLFGITVYSVGAFGQTTPPVSIGLNGGLNFNFHNPNFPTPNPKFTASAMGLGGAVGIGLNYPISNSFVLGARIGYNNLSGKLESSYDSTISQATAKITDTRDASIAALEITPIALFPNLIMNNMYVFGGLELGFNLKSDYTQTLKQTLNNVDTTKSVTGGIPDAGSRFAIAAGLGYDIAMGTTHIQPELSVRFPFTKISSNTQFDTWTVPQIRLGVNLMFDMTSTPDTSRRIEEQPFVEPKFKRVISFNQQGDTIDIRQVKVEDIQYSELYPLVPYIFFNKEGKKVDSSLVIPRKRETGDSPDNLFTSLNDAVKINYSILDVVCARMKKYENAKLNIIGTNDGSTEVKNKNLAKERAEQVRDYLISCGVNADRLVITARDLPEKASAVKNPDGQAENRRVELRSDTPEILEPVVSKQELERIAEPDLLEFIPDVKTSDPITSWNLELTQAGRTLRSIPGIGDAKPVRWAIRPSELSDKQVPIDYIYTVENARGAKQTFTGSLPVDYLSSLRKKQEKLADRTIDKFSLILFDFDSDVLTPDNQRILEQKVVGAIKFNSTVKIFGYTDRIGDDKYNKTLSLRRANSVMEALKAKYKDVKFEAYGLGETKQLFDNDVPVGRQLNRTVQIIVETPR